MDTNQNPKSKMMMTIIMGIPIEKGGFRRRRTSSSLPLPTCLWIPEKEVSNREKRGGQEPCYVLARHTEWSIEQTKKERGATVLVVRTYEREGTWMGRVTRYVISKIK